MLRRYTWEAARDRCRYYKRRSPETTELYRVVYHARDMLPRVWEERFQPVYGVLRSEVLSALDSYLNCGLLEHGAARVYCDACRHSILVAFSCKKRGVCPSCSTKRAIKFAEHLHYNVLARVPHRHVVFTLPKRLRPYVRYDRSLGGILFNAAWGAVEECLGSGCAAVLTLQTAGEALNFNPHLHGIMADGVFSTEGVFAPFSSIDLERLSARFSERVLYLLSKKELITDDVTSQILSQEHSGFSVWLGEPFHDPDSERFVARYVERGPLSLEKLSVTDDIVAYATKDGLTHEFDALEFLALLSSHIPNTYESLTRYYGYYSCRARGERLKREVSSKNTEPIPEEHSLPSATWAACIKRVYEINPLECPKCKGEMRIVAFVRDPVEIKNIMLSLGLPNFRAPPPVPIPTPYPHIDDSEHFD